jgi:hypothetical protein
MSLKTLIAMLLIAVGIVALAYGGLSYRSRETAIDLGNLHVTTERAHHVPLPPVAGALAIGVGVTLLVVDVKKFAPVGARSCLVLGHIGLRLNPKRGICHFGHSGLAEGQIHAWVSCKHT